MGKFHKDNELLTSSLKSFDEDIVWSKKSKYELEAKIMKEVSESNLTSSHRNLNVKNLIPNLLTAAVLFIGLFFVTDFILNQETSLLNGNQKQDPEQSFLPGENPEKNNEEVVDSHSSKENDETAKAGIDEATAKTLIGRAFAMYSVILNGGGPEMGETFSLEGKSYRYLGEDFDTKEKVYDYLGEVYTVEIIDQIFSTYTFIVHDDKLAQLDEVFTTELAWQDTEPVCKSVTESLVEAELKIPISETVQFETYTITLRNVQGGWRVDDIIPFNLD